MLKVASILAAALVAAPVLAHAQQGLMPSTSTKLGFPLGEKSRIHPGLLLGMAFDSNPQRFDDGTPDARSDWRGIIRPGLAVRVPGESLSLNLLGSVSISQFVGSGPLAAETKFGGAVGLDFNLGSMDGPASFRIENQFLRTPVFLEDPGTIAADERRFQEFNNRGSARLTVRPGGRALELELGYLNQISAYDALTSSQIHGGLAEVRWRFLPKTAFVLHTDVSRFTPFKERVPNQTLDATPFNATLGVVGQVTQRLAAEAIAGYANTFSSGDAVNSNGFIGSFGLTYALSEESLVQIIYRRRVSSIAILNSYVGDSINAQARFGLGGRFAFTAFGSYENRRYPGVVGVTSSESTVNLVNVDARAEYWFFEFMSGAIGYRLQMQDPSTSIGETAFLQDFSRHMVLFTTNFIY